MKMKVAVKDVAKPAGPAPSQAQKDRSTAFVDQRPASVAQRQRQDIANTGKQGMQLKAWSALMNDGLAPAVAQLAQHSSHTVLAGPVAQRQTAAKRALQYGMLGGLAGARAGVYGALAGAAIGAGYGYLTADPAAPTSFANHQKAGYDNELAIYHGWLATVPQAASAYNSGQFYTYTSANASIIHDMLCKGKLMYTYDTGNRLRVSGNHANIKHALLAENRNVYAAGTVDLDNPQKNQLAMAITEAKTRVENEENMQGLKDGAQKEEFRFIADEAKKKLVSLGYAASASVDSLVGLYENVAVQKADAHLMVTEDSGHYSPTYDSGHKAVEAWRNAGYNRISWTPRWTKRTWMQSSVKNVNRPPR